MTDFASLNGGSLWDSYNGLDDDSVSSTPSPTLSSFTFTIDSNVEDILLVIEISDTTLEYDRTTKLTLYAEAGIINYWIVNLQVRQLECYSQPYQDARGEFSYLNKQIFLTNHSVKIPGFEDALLELSRIFPQQ